NRGDGSHDAIEDAGRVAGGRGAWQRHFWKDAAQAGRVARQNIHGDAIGGDDAAVDPGFACFDAGVVEQIARLEIIRAVHHQIDAGDNRLDIIAVDVFSQCGDLDLRVDAPELISGGDGLGQVARQIVFIKEHLALKV